MQSTLKISDNFILQWKFNEDEIEFVIDWKVDSWFGLGYKKVMADCDMIVFETERDGYIRDLWSTGWRTPSTDSSQDITLIAY